MSTLFEDLRAAREAKGISLEDIADITLINVEFLRALERGDTSILPQTYVRAFLREYAGVVGFDKDDVMKRYDGFSTSTPDVPPPQPLLNQAEQAPTGIGSGMIRGVLIGVVVVAVGFGAWSLINTPPATPPAEIPFQNVLKETESRVVGPQRPDASPALRVAVANDSLTLRATMIDTVWVHIVIDDGPPHEYLFRPKNAAVWRAARRFSITAGNAGALTLRLNTKDLGAPGKRGAVVRNLELTHETLK